MNDKSIGMMHKTSEISAAVHPHLQGRCTPLAYSLASVTNSSHLVGDTGPESVYEGYSFGPSHEVHGHAVQKTSASHSSRKADV